MSVKSVDTWSSGHTSKLNVLFTGLKEFVSKNCIVGVSVKISGHTDFWTHNRTIYIFNVLKWFVLKTYMGMYVLISGHMDFWTNNKLISLCSAYPNDLFWYALCICQFKSLDTWTCGHTTKQCQSSVYSSDLSWNAVCTCQFKSVDTWTCGHTIKQW